MPLLKLSTVRLPGRRATGAVKPPARRGQVLVIFAFMLTILIGMAAFVVDLAWIWSHQLQVQRAADAGALAGVVYLPGDVGSATSTALAESRKNGYRDSVGGVDVNARQDADNERQMVVTVSAPVDTFFMGLFGFDQVTVSRTGRAEFVLPVPMGSPQNYYGVGEYQAMVSRTSTSTSTYADSTAWRVPSGSAPSGGGWAFTPTGSGKTITTSVTSENDEYATSSANGQVQQWANFGLTGSGGILSPAANQTVAITGLEVRLTDAFMSASCANSRIAAALSWNGGGSWSTSVQSPALGTNTSTGDYVLPSTGGSSSTAAWGSHAWVRNNFSNANFRVRLTSVNGCSGAPIINLDRLEVRAYYTVTTTTTTVTTTQEMVDVVGPDGTTLNPQRFWGASITLGGQRTNGDQHGPASDGGGANADHDPGGYDYSVEVGASGQVWIFDAGFCGTGPNGTGGWFGAGDHWINNDYADRVTTQFRLYNTAGTPYNETDDALIPTDAGFPNLSDLWLVDKSGEMGTPQSNAPGDCSGLAWHNDWVPLARNLAPGTYRLNVTTASPLNNSTNAENGWSAWVTGGAEPRVYGGGRMVAYNNLRAGVTDFYLAQIDPVHAGKTLEMQLFDPDASSNGTLSILSPDGGSYNVATFDYTADGNCTGSSDSCSATGRTQIRVVNGGSQGFNNSVVTITIPLPTSYGSGGLAEDGWWKIRYNVSGGNDTTTWKVTIRGNPVHLVVP